MRAGGYGRRATRSSQLPARLVTSGERSTGSVSWAIHIEVCSPRWAGRAWASSAGAWHKRSVISPLLADLWIDPPSRRSTFHLTAADRCLRIGIYWGGVATAGLFVYTARSSSASCMGLTRERAPRRAVSSRAILAAPMIFFETTPSAASSTASPPTPSRSRRPLAPSPSGPTARRRSSARSPHLRRQPLVPLCNPPSTHLLPVYWLNMLRDARPAAPGGRHALPRVSPSSPRRSTASRRSAPSARRAASNRSGRHSSRPTRAARSTRTPRVSELDLFRLDHVGGDRRDTVHLPASSCSAAHSTSPAAFGLCITYALELSAFLKFGLQVGRSTSRRGWRASSASSSRRRPARVHLAGRPWTATATRRGRRPHRRHQDVRALPAGAAARAARTRSCTARAHAVAKRGHRRLIAPARARRPWTSRAGAVSSLPSRGEGCRNHAGRRARSATDGGVLAIQLHALRSRRCSDRNAQFAAPSSTLRCSDLLAALQGAAAAERRHGRRARRPAQGRRGVRAQGPRGGQIGRGLRSSSARARARSTVRARAAGPAARRREDRARSRPPASPSAAPGRGARVRRFADATVFTIAHRLLTIMDSTKLLVSTRERGRQRRDAHAPRGRVCALLGARQRPGVLRAAADDDLRWECRQRSRSRRRRLVDQESPFWLVMRRTIADQPCARRWGLRSKRVSASTMRRSARSGGDRRGGDREGRMAAAAPRVARKYVPPVRSHITLARRLPAGYLWPRARAE